MPKKMRRGFTVTELLVYMAVAATALASVFVIHNMAQRASTTSQTNVTLQRTMRSILERVTREVRWATNLELITAEHQDYAADPSDYDTDYIYIRLNSGNVQMLRWNQAQSTWTISNLNETGFTEIDSFSVNLEAAGSRKILSLDVTARDAATKRSFEANTSVVVLNGALSELGVSSNKLRFQPPPDIDFQTEEQGPAPDPDPPPDPEPDPEPAQILTVNGIEYETWGGNNHLRVFVDVQDENNSSVSGASVSVELKRDGNPYTSSSGTTGNNGRVTFNFQQAPSGT